MLIGGAEKHAIALANNLDRTRFRAGLCFLKSHGSLSSELDVHNLQLVLPLGVRKKADWAAAAALAKQLDEHSIDIIVATNGYPMLYALVASWLSRREVRLVEVYHTTGMRTPIKSRVRMALNWLVFRQCELLVYVSHRQREFWRARWWRAKRDVVIHNGIDTEYFTDRYTPDEKAQVRARYGFSPQDYVVGICASLRPEKAHLDVLRAVRRLRESGIPARLLIVGDGSERARIEQKAAEWNLTDAVAITGFQADVRPLIAACDVMVLASHAVETFSIAALESMSMAKPVVLSRIGGAEEQVTHGATGFLFAPADVEALTEHLRTLANPELRQQMGLSAAHVVREKFTTQRMIGAFMQEFQTLVPNPVGIARAVPS
jgi:L-malate glycosyltransferase